MKKHKITNYQRLMQQSTKNIEWYWNAVNKELNLKWFRKYDRLIDPSNGISDTNWFIGGKCNIVANAIDRHVKSQPDKIAYIFENPNKATRKVSYRKLAHEVNILACAIKDAGVKKGDAVGIYMPLISEALIAIFACSEIGAVRTTIFSGFNTKALYSRLKDAGATILITACEMERRSVTIDLKKQ
jgi:acetyl-CoA synthetase